LILLDW